MRLAADRRVAHVRTVHRAAVGDALRVGVLGGRLGTAVVARLDDAGLELDVTLERDPPPALPLVLVLALPRPKAMRRVLQTVATLGIKRLCLVAAWRVEKSYWESPLLTPARVADELVLGLEQGGDTVAADGHAAPALQALRRGRARGARGGEPPAARASDRSASVPARRRHAGHARDRPRGRLHGRTRSARSRRRTSRRCRSARASSASSRPCRRSSAGSSDRRGTLA